MYNDDFENTENETNVSENTEAQFGTSENTGQQKDEYVFVEQKQTNERPYAYGYNYNANYGHTQYTHPTPPKRRSNAWVIVLTACITIAVCALIGLFVFYRYMPASNTVYNEKVQTPVPTQAAKSTPDTTPSGGLVIGDKTASGTDNVIAKCMKTVVSINIEVVQQGYFGDNVATGAGSGVILTQDGYIVTCNHVVEGANNIYVTLQDGTKYDAKVVGYDSRTDLAVIKIEAENLPTATIGSSDSYTVGSRVYAIGNPLGELATTVTNGIISGIDRSVEIDGVSMTLMQTDAAINPGNSGGGLFSQDTGELLGIVNAKNYGTEIEGLGFAIPTSAAHDIIVELMDKGYVSGRPYLGITLETVSSGGQSFFGFGNVTYYARIKDVIEGSPAESAGLKSGDLIVSIGNTNVSSADEVYTALNNYNAGDTVEMVVQRGTGTQTISVTLGERSGN